MKRTLITLSLFGLWLSSFSQSYHPMLNHSAWYMMTNYGWTGISYGWQLQQNDTLLSGNIYSKICTPTNYLVAMIRDDTAARRVYYYNVNNHTDYLLYDFSLNVGDSIYIHHPQQSPTDSIKGKVTLVDTINTLGGPRRRQQVCYNCNTVPFSGRYVNAVEGIGSLELPFSLYNPVNDPVHQLVCNYQNQVHIYRSSPSDPCTTPPVGIKELSFYAPLTCSYDPATSLLHVSFLEENYSCRVIDLYGRTVAESKSPGRNCQVDMTGKTGGIYFVLLNNGRTYKASFVKE